MTGPCLCGDPECGRCFPGGQRRFVAVDLADAVAAWSYTLGAKAGPADLSALSPSDVADLVELTIHAVRAKLAGGRRKILDTERALDSELAQRAFDLIRDFDHAEAVRAAER